MEEKKENIENDPGFPKLETGYSVPEGYFETFGARLQQRMSAEKKSPSWGNVIYYLKPALAIAAGLVIILTVYLYPPGNQKTSSVASMDNVPAAPVEEQSDLLTSTYASLITDGQLISALTEMDEYDASKMPKEELADYLASNCSDIEILYASK